MSAVRNLRGPGHTVTEADRTAKFSIRWQVHIGIQGFNVQVMVVAQVIVEFGEQFGLLGLLDQIVVPAVIETAGLLKGPVRAPSA